ncbi:hypothetical protein [Streptomyces anandii]|uniref:hypothetical protein n=1 Tax=Streptomyces anandii TaxID=285454 RepID=UPI0037925F84
MCKTTSRPYPTAGRADARGQTHRDEHHDGDHPDGERIEQIARTMPERGELTAFALVAGLILIALLVKII